MFPCSAVHPVMKCSPASNSRLETKGSLLRGVEEMLHSDRGALGWPAGRNVWRKHTGTEKCWITTACTALKRKLTAPQGDSVQLAAFV